MARRAGVARDSGILGPRGPEDGPPALVIPGFIANDRTTMELRRALAAGGWRVHPWGLGWNLGAKADTIERLEARLDAIDDPRPVLVVGWSLGGVFARELARARPERVRAVVTLGSPFSGDPHANNVWRLYEWVARHKVDDPPIPRDSRQAAGADAGDLVAARRDRRGRARRADWPRKATRRSSFTAATWRSACRGGWRTRWCRKSIAS